MSNLPVDKFADLKRRLWFLLLALIVYRIGAHVPVPGIDPVVLKDLFESDTADKSSVEAAAEKIKSAMLEVHDAFKAVIDAMKEAVSASGKIETVS